VAELAAHARHDRLLVAESVDRGARRSPMLELCARCAALYSDLIALTMALPRSAIPSRTRDFRLSAGDARRLGRGRWWAWSESFGSARDSLTRPLAIGFATVGLAGLRLTAGSRVRPLVGAAIGSGSAGSAPLVRDLATADPTDVPSGVLGVEPTAPAPELLVTDRAHDPDSAIALSAGLFGIGVGLFAARRVAGRRHRVR